MNARGDFGRGTGWEADYVSARRSDAAVVGYRGPFPTEGDIANIVKRMLGPLLDSLPPSPPLDSDGFTLAAGADRMLIAWRKDRPIGVLTARNVHVGHLTGWHLTAAIVDPEFRRKRLCRELIETMVSEEPTDFVSVVTNHEGMYRAARSASPGAEIHPDRSGRCSPQILALANDVMAQLFHPSPPPTIDGDLVARGLLPAGTATDQDPEDRFRSSLRLSATDVVFVVSDVSGVLGAGRRAKHGPGPVTVKDRLRNITVTGTNGKTSCVELGRQLSQAAGLQAGSFGTLGVITERGRHRAPQVRRGRRAVPQLADQLWSLGHDVLWTEGFSYALSRALFDRLPVDVAIFTQLGLDHLGIHHSLAAYRAAKERLFQAIVVPEGSVVVDPTTEGAAQILSIAERRDLNVVTTGAGNHVEIGGGRLRVGDRHFPCTVPFIEPIMVGNLELAVAANLVLGLDPAVLADAIVTLRSPPGRFEVLDLGTSFRVVIDSAHNADALEASLGEWRTRTTGRLLVVVASVGSADVGRWEPIGEVADVLADIVVVTDESPHRGDADAIRKAIRRGCPRALDIADRQAAIDWLVTQAGDDDTLVVTGRADEDFLIDEHGSISYPTDAELVTNALTRLGARA